MNPADAKGDGSSRRASGMKAGGGGERVWYPVDNEGDWIPCTLIARVPGGGATLKIKGKDVSVRPEDVTSKLLPREEKATQNLADLPRDGLGPAGVEDVLRQQVCNMLPYTNAADVLVAVNPMREMNIYDSKMIDKYAELKPGLPPHVYNAAAMAYKTMTDKRSNQSIVLAGGSGTGKSKAMSHLTAFLAQTSGSDPIDSLLRDEMDAMLRPFISLSVQSDSLKWLSTRALVSLELSFDDDDFICRVSASVQMLETRRVAQPGDGPNYEALYLAFSDRDEAKKWLGDKEEFKLLGQDFDADDFDMDGSQLEKWKQALKAFSIPEELTVRLLCGILLLGEVRFSKGPAGVTCEGVEAAAKALGVDAAQFSAALTQGGDEAAATNALTWTIEDMYRALVASLLQKANAAMVGDSKSNGLTITIIDVPSFPSGWPDALTPPTGFDSLQLQWLVEVVGSSLLLGALQPTFAQEDVDLSRLSWQQTTQEAKNVIAGQNGIISALRKITHGRPDVPEPTLAKKALEEWSKSQEKVACVTLKQTRCEITGSFCKAGHQLDHSLVQGAVSGKRIPALVKKLLAQSTMKNVTEITGLLSKETSALDEAQNAVDMVQGLLQGKGKVRPWIICCMRPNDKGKKDLVSQPVMTMQVSHLLLSDMVHFLGDKKVRYSIAWPLDSFRTEYASLMPTLDKSMSDLEASRIIVQSVGGGQGTVGAEVVYGTKEMLQILKVKLQEKETEANAKQALRKSMNKLVDGKIEGLDKKLDEVEKGQDRKLETAVSSVDRKVQEQIAAQQEQMAELRRAPSKERSAAEQEQMPASQRADLAKERDIAPAELRPSTNNQAKAPNQDLPPTRGSGSTGVLSKGAKEHLRRLSRKSVRLSSVGELMVKPPSPPSSSGDENDGYRTGRTPSGKIDRGPLRGMSLPQHGTLHSALTQMAAVLRVAKESEAKLVEGQKTRHNEVEELRQEANAWRIESDRLWVQVKELQHQLQEGGSNVVPRFPQHS
mmetsp:Transcript_12421/g.20332  ORF Transcript_12421/g.20332 Transcript_12421/m.20332 type:complete len:999 (-) Transcript_12421:70-3066(-)